MSAAHTEGRIEYRENGDANSYALLDQGGKWLLSLLHNGEPLVDVQRANLRRLAACWNACDGLTMDHFDGGWTAKGLSHHAKAMEDQLAAARALLQELIDTEGPQPGTAAWAEKVRAFLAGEVS